MEIVFLYVINDNAIVVNIGDGFRIKIGVVERTEFWVPKVCDVGSGSSAQVNVQELSDFGQRFWLTIPNTPSVGMTK